MIMTKTIQIKENMKVLIWIHKKDAVKNTITDYTLTRPHYDRHDEWVQVEITTDYFARLEDKENGATYPEFVEKHYSKPISD